MNDSSKYGSSDRKEFVVLTNERKNALGAVGAFGSFAGRYAEDKSVIDCGQQEVEYFNRVKQCIELRGLSDRVEMLGHINHVKLEQELSRAMIFLLP